MSNPSYALKVNKFDLGCSAKAVENINSLVINYFLKTSVLTFSKTWALTSFKKREEKYKYHYESGPAQSRAVRRSPLAQYRQYHIKVFHKYPHWPWPSFWPDLSCALFLIYPYLSFLSFAWHLTYLPGFIFLLYSSAWIRLSHWPCYVLDILTISILFWFEGASRSLDNWCGTFRRRQSVPSQYFQLSTGTMGSKSCMSDRSQSSMNGPICPKEAPRTVYATQKPLNNS